MIKFKNLWLLLTGLILSTVILTTGNAAYNNRINHELTNDTNSTNGQNQTAKNDKPANTKTQNTAKSQNSVSSGNNLIFSVLPENHSQVNNELTDQSSTDKKDESNQKQSEQNQPSQTPTTPEPKQTQIVNQTVDLSIQSIGDFHVEFKEGDTAWDIMKRAAAQYHFPMTYKVYDFGIYVIKIGDLESKSNYYWALYYNDGYSMVGASDLKIKPNDKIEWKYETWSW